MTIHLSSAGKDEKSKEKKRGLPGLGIGVSGIKVKAVADLMLQE